jgi:hypothetical protein
MRPTAILGAVLALIVALVAISWLTSPAPGSNVVATGPANPQPVTPAAETKAAADGKEHAVEPAAPKQDVNMENPFDLTGKGPQPKVEANDTTYPFGEMTLGDTGKHEFTIKNLGEAPLKLAKGKSTCKCTIPFVADKDVPPGGEVSVTLEWVPKALDLEFRQTATIWTNDPDHPSVELTVSGLVLPECLQTPLGSFQLGELKQGESRTFEGHVFNRVRTDLEVTKIVPSSDRITVEYEPADPAVLEENSAKSGVVMTIKLLPSNDIGLIQESVEVHLNSERNPTMRWDISGNRVGPLKIVGPSWFAAEQLVMLGQFNASEGAEKKLSLFLDKGEAPLKVEDVKSDGPIQVRVERDESFKNADRDRYWLIVGFPKEGLAGIYRRAKPLKVDVTTNREDVPRIQLNVAYEAI